MVVEEEVVVSELFLSGGVHAGQGVVRPLQLVREGVKRLHRVFLHLLALLLIEGYVFINVILNTFSLLAI